jgi:nicotinamidase-related amidase
MSWLRTGMRLHPGMREIVLGLAIFGCTGVVALRARGRTSRDHRYFRLRLRTRVEAFKNDETWHEAYFEKTFDSRKTVILICDMWDKHWCRGATRRVNILAGKIKPLLNVARAAGVQIIHAPSDTMDFYRNYPQRKVMIEQTLVNPPTSLGLADPPLPIDDSDGGCDTPGDYEHQVWTRENPRIRIAKGDVISDNGNQIYSFLRSHGIGTVFFMGVHVNMCILNRTFGIKQLANWGVQCVLLRDLTDSMYNPKDRPYVSHAEGTELVIEHIERYWCPTATGADLMKSLKQRGKWTSAR